ncbi:winged helix-turn-helix transcriptional regulator [Caldalkalibacillus mannanilyticus]|uniref:winged helix-turn-helix transcriptional regulator n=1 Tax=Caldalkalibacillus mannanilyticus TaxID=1418 RepID=UPI000B128D81|nr:helix-turn-helix domain-containing protein [Caldalkalibacillus mannanilyticus]
MKRDLIIRAEKGVIVLKMRKKFTCPLELTHDMIKGKWKSIILWRLRLGNTSLSRLEADIAGISQKMLLEQLKELIEMGFVDKEVFEGYPLRVEYFLTPKRGKKILEALTIMQSLGIDFMLENGMEDFLVEKGVIKTSSKNLL